MQDNRGQNNGSSGKFNLNSIKVLIVGSGPGADGYVLIFSKAVPSSGGTKLFRLKTTNPFLTGRIPTDYKSLNPKTFIVILNSLKSTLSFRLT